MFSNIRQYYQILKYHSNVTKKHFWMIQRAKNEVFDNILEFGLLDWLDIAYYDRTKCVPTFGNTTRSWRIIQKSPGCIFEWSKVPKMRFFGHFLECGLLVRLDIAYFDGTKCFLTFGNDTRWWRIFQKSQKCIFEWSKEPKRGFWPFSWVWSVGSTWYCIFWWY